ncbi:MAG TPA: glycerol-3-phosphate dehydrogenase/oxidase [Planctomicrobium sp.]|nr:glycerol-3-phosphate dehydrogenase/oxidase [Planctomicrobium sp.]
MSHREQLLERLTAETWDVAIIGGGATGLGAAVDAVSRGFRTVLIEQSDFAKATSSRSTKLIHGGVRYLKQGNISLVRESLHERELLLKNAFGLVRPLEFIIPTFSFPERLFYATGLKAYDFLAGKRGMASSKMLSTNEVQQRVSTIQTDRLSGGVSYYDAQFDDARLVMAMASSVTHHGGVPLNYVKCVGLLKQGERLAGVTAEDVETGRQYEVKAKAFINATGIFTDSMRHLDDPLAKPMMKVSRGSHLVVDRSFLPGETAIIIPKTSDGRVVFIIPWHGAVLIGTTDIAEPSPILDPAPTEEEVIFLLECANRFLTRQVKHSDIRSMFCGLRPLVSSGHDGSSTSKLSRDHVIRTSESGLVTITGGKWTTYRRMGSDAVDTAIKVAGLGHRPSTTQTLHLTGNLHDSPQQPQTTDSVTDEFVLHAIREEQARTIEDVLSRRCRLLLLDAQGAINVAPRVAALLATELQLSPEQTSAQLENFVKLAKTYLPHQ